MDEFKEGDLVEAVKGDTVIRGRLHRSAAGGWWVGGSSRMYSGLRGSGYTITLVESAPSPLPTDAGTYRDAGGAILTLDPETVDYAPRWFLWSEFITDNEARKYLPLTRLESVPVTAKRVLESINALYGENFLDNPNTAWNRVAAVFGVTEP